jgi:aminobenzoyl-glutamate transport protein
MDSIIPITMFLFLIPGLAYGYAAGTIKSGRDTSAMISKALAEMGPFMALAFVAAQFLAFFQWSNLGPIIAIKGAEFLQNIGLTGLGLLIGFIVVSCLINILIASASAKWAILSPIFVPMFMLLGYHPAFTQLAYRIGDSITNPITPLLPYFPILLGFAQQYDEDLGMGTLISLLLPYTIFFAIFWILLFVAWFFLGLPLGPGAFINL